MKPYIINQVRKLIAEGKTKKVFDLLKIHLSHAQSELAIIEAEYNELKNAELKGTLSSEAIQLRKNQINNKLLSLLENEPSPISTTLSKNNLWKIILPFGVVAAMFGLWFLFSNTQNCPTFPPDFKNNILVMPFENVGNLQNTAKPQTILKNKINQLAKENNLSSIALLNENFESMSNEKAHSLGENCYVDLLIWGEYSSRANSIYLILNYSFTDQPDWNLSYELIALKDVTAIQSGQMSKSLDDAIFSLCGIIAIRENKNELAEKWFDKVK